MTLCATLVAGQSGPPVTPPPTAACGGCHVVAPPGVLPKAAWPDSVLRMQRIREGSEASAAPSTRLPADFLAALAWYQRYAPSALARPADWPAPAVSPLLPRGLTPPGAPPTPVVADVTLTDLDQDSRLELIVCDMRHGMLLLGRPYDPAAGLTLIARVPHPSRAQVVDLDGDGVRDVLVADLGESLPRDHDKGAVVWLRGLGGGRFSPFAIGGLPRIASVEAADLDSDGDKDLIVAAFGYRKTGSALVLENRTTDWVRPAFSPLALDGRPGAVRALATDINNDGRLDVVAVVAQEHEEVVAYLRGDGLSFTPQILWKAPHPNWGFSGMSMADLDADGDLDIVASALVAGGAGPDDERLPAIVWLEQTSRRRFERRTLKRGTPRHAALAAGDYDVDGDVDLVSGNMATTGPISAWVDVWENRRR